MRIFRLPDLGEGLQEAELVEWRVQPGQTVSVDEPLLAVETAKAVVERRRTANPVTMLVRVSILCSSS